MEPDAMVTLFARYWTEHGQRANHDRRQTCRAIRVQPDGPLVDLSTRFRAKQALDGGDTDRSHCPLDCGDDDSRGYGRVTGSRAAIKSFDKTPLRSLSTSG